MDTFACLITRYPKLNILAITLVTILFGYQIVHIRMETALESFYIRGDKDISFAADFESVFGSSDVIVIGMEGLQMTSLSALSKIERITGRLEELPCVEEVVSLANVLDVSPIQDGVRIEPLQRKFPERRMVQGDLHDLIKRNPFCLRNLISEDGTASSITIFLRENPEIQQNRKRIIEAIEKILSREQEMQFHLAGKSLIEVKFTENQLRDLKIFMPSAFLVLVLVLYFCFHSLRGVLLPLSTVTIASLWTVGLFAWTGRILNNYTATMPLFILIVGSAYSIHLLTQYYEEVLQSSGRREVVTNTLRNISWPILFTGLTTMIGFGALVLHRVISVSEIGWFVPFGVFSSCMITLVFIPSVLLLIPLPEPAKAMRFEGNWTERLLQRTGKIVANHRASILVFTGILSVLGTLGLFLIRADFNVLKWFQEDSDLRRAVDFLDRELAGAKVLNISLRAKQAERFVEPVILQGVDRLEAFIRSQDAVDYAISVATVVKYMHQQFHGGDPRFYSIPESREMIAQYLLLFSMSGEGTLRRLISDEGEWIAIFGRIRSNLSTGQVKNLHSAIQHEASRRFPNDIEVRATGDEKLWNNLIDALGEGVYTSLVFATLLIAVLFGILVRSLRGALFCMIPNVIPILYCMGAWGLLGIPIDLGSAIIASIVIGIAADDTIHFVTRFNKELVLSQDFTNAMSITLKTCGRAMFYTTMTLSLGFSIFMLSAFGPLKNGGKLSVPPVILAFLGDVVIFPALLLSFKPSFMKKKFFL